MFLNLCIAAYGVNICLSNGFSLRYAGVFLLIQIQTWTEKEGRDKMHKTDFLPGLTRGVVKNLKPHSLNKAQILAFNRAYEGPFSEVVSFTTPQGRKWRLRVFIGGTCYDSEQLWT